MTWLTNALTHVALPLAALCALAYVVTARRQHREVRDYIHPAVAVLAEDARRRADDEAWRRLVRVVDAAAFDRTAEQIRRLPETEETTR